MEIVETCLEPLTAARKRKGEGEEDSGVQEAAGEECGKGSAPLARRFAACFSIFPVLR